MQAFEPAMLSALVLWGWCSVSACGRVEGGTENRARTVPCSDPARCGDAGAAEPARGDAGHEEGIVDDGRDDGESAGADDCVGEPTSDLPYRPAPDRDAHRAVATQCERERPCNSISRGVPDAIVCTSHVDCSDGVNGRCQLFGYECTYDQCFSDADCESEELCDCAGGLNGAHRCLPAQCRVDADCPNDAWCSPSPSVQCSNLDSAVGYYCHTAADECTSDAECPVACVFDPDASHWRCSESSCTVP